MKNSRFNMNGISWEIRFVKPDSPMLVDRTRTLTVGTTDPKTKTIYLSNYLSGEFLMTVLLHELGHAALYSFDFLDEIHQMTYPDSWIDIEEFICNFLADYGRGIFRIGYKFLGNDAWKLIPEEFNNRFR